MLHQKAGSQYITGSASSPASEGDPGGEPGDPAWPPGPAPPPLNSAAIRELSLSANQQKLFRGQRKVLSHDSILYAALILLRRFPIGCQLAFCFKGYSGRMFSLITKHPALAIAADVAAGRADGVAIVGDVAGGRRFRHREGGVFRHLAGGAWLIQAGKLGEWGRNLPLEVLGHQHRRQHRLIHLGVVIGIHTNLFTSEMKRKFTWKTMINNKHSKYSRQICLSLTIFHRF